MSPSSFVLKNLGSKTISLSFFFSPKPKNELLPFLKEGTESFDTSSTATIIIGLDGIGETVGTGEGLGEGSGGVVDWGGVVAGE